MSVELIEERGARSGSDELASTALLAVTLCAVLLTVGFVPGMVHSWEAPRAVLFIAAAPLAIAGLFVLVRRRDLSAALWAALLAWSLIGALAAESSAISLVGSIGRQSSWLIVLGACGLWVLGRSMSPNGTALLSKAVVAAGALSICIAVVQLLAQPAMLDMALEQGRPVGLAGNPIYFGAQMAGISALFAYRVRDAPSVGDFAGFALFSFGSALSGSRVAALVCVLLALGPALYRRWALVARLLVIAVAANLTAVLLHWAVGTGQSAGARVGSSGVQDRLDLWSFGFRAWLDRPILGAGIGRFRPATQTHYSDAWAGRFSDDRSGAWMDAHNLFVEHLVTTGIVGVALLCGLLLVVARHARGPFALGSLSIAFTWLLEPAALPALGLAVLFLGVSMPVNVERTALNRNLVMISAVVGLLAGGWYLAGMRTLHVWLRDPPASVAEMPSWPMWRVDPLVPATVADLMSDGAVEWSRRSVDLEPDFPYWRSSLALDLLAADAVHDAEVAAETSLQFQPNHVRSLEALQIAALRLDDSQKVDEVTARLCTLGSPSCGFVPGAQP